MSDARFQDAIARIDAANADDPETLRIDGVDLPKELTHARMLTGWVRRLRPDAHDVLLLAARAHHVRRWTIPRGEYPAGRRGYLRWRTALHQFHADEVERLLADAGYEEPVIGRVQQLVRKVNLRRDPDVQTLEDGLCLVFLDTQLSDLRRKHPESKLIDVLQKTWKKMSPRARELALELELDADDRALIERALADSGLDGA